MDGYSSNTTVKEEMEPDFMNPYPSTDTMSDTVLTIVEYVRATVTGVRIQFKDMLDILLVYDLIKAYIDYILPSLDMKDTSDEDVIFVEDCRTVLVKMNSQYKHQQRLFDRQYPTAERKDIASRLAKILGG